MQTSKQTNKNCHIIYEIQVYLKWYDRLRASFWTDVKYVNMYFIR